MILHPNLPSPVTLLPFNFVTYLPLHLSTSSPLHLSISITFVIPDVHAFQSGGNIYNKNLIAGLRENGQVIEVMDLDGFKKLPIAQLQGHYFFDTLYFTQLAPVFAKKNKVYSTINRMESASIPKAIGTSSGSTKPFGIKSNKQVHFWLIVHHLESLYPPKNWTALNYFQLKEYPSLVQFDGFLTSSQFTADYLSINLLKQSKIVIPPAIDYLPSTNFSRKITPIKALIVANLVERKGILPFLQKLNASPLVQYPDKIKIQLIGSAVIEKTYAQKCITFLNKNPTLRKVVSYEGQLSSVQLHSYYQESNLFISTAFMETYGMALQEARAFRLPILALDGGNVKHHIIQGSTGYLAKDLNNLVHKLENFVASPSSLATLQKYIKENVPIFDTWKQAGVQLIRQLSPL